MSRLAQARMFVWVSVLLITVGVFRSSWATRLDGFTIDEPWHITAGVSYFRTGEYYLNPEHPPLVKLVAALALPFSAFRFVPPDKLNDKITERNFVQDTMYEHNDADAVQSRVRRVMYLFNGLLLLAFAWAVFRVAGAVVAVGALTFALIDPTVAAHWPVVMTDLPVGLLSVTSVLLCIQILRHWSWTYVGLLGIALGLTLSAKHSGVITFGFVATLGTGTLMWKHWAKWPLAALRLVAFVAVLGCAVSILWGMYRFQYYESQSRQEKFNRPLSSKIEDVRSPFWRFALTKLVKYHVFPRPYMWGLADVIRTGMEGRASSTLAFGHVTFMERRPFIFPGYIAVKLPIPLLALSLFGCVMMFRKDESKTDKQTAGVLLALAALLLVILARSNAEWAGVRHAITVCIVMVIMSGFGVRHLLSLRPSWLGITTLVVITAACGQALAGERPWEYHNILGGGTKDAYRYFRNDGVDLGQRDKEIADYCRRKLEPNGEVPWVGYRPFSMKPDLIDYRHVKLSALNDPLHEEIPPATITGTILISGTDTAPAIWYDNKALRQVQPVDRMGTVLVYRGTFYLPNIRAGALFNRATTLFEQRKPDVEKIESLLEEAIALKPDDFSGWMLMGNLHLLRGERDAAVAAFERARDNTPQSPVRILFEEQSRRVAAGSRQLMRDPGIE